MEQAKQNAMTFKLKIWRQKNAQTDGAFKDYTVGGITTDMSFLEMLDVLNQNLIKAGDEPVVFDHDCREGICGTCGMVINGAAHGPIQGTTVCQLQMRHFKDGDEIVIEPWRARSFPVQKDLSVDRSAFDRIMAVGGFVSVKTGNAPEANSVPVPKQNADLAFDFAACIGCGACVAACKNASASLFVGAKMSQLSLLPHGQPERERRALAMVKQMDAEGFGACSVTGACSAVCPKNISLEAIARMNREFTKASCTSRD